MDLSTMRIEELQSSLKAQELPLTERNSEMKVEQQALKAASGKKYQKLEDDSEGDSEGESDSKGESDSEGEYDFDPDSNGNSDSGNIPDFEGGHTSKGGTYGVSSSDIVPASEEDFEQVQRPQRIKQIPRRFEEISDSEGEYTFEGDSTSKDKSGSDGDFESEDASESDSNTKVEENSEGESDDDSDSGGNPTSNNGHAYEVGPFEGVPSTETRSQRICQIPQ
ncbi:uncharacterized protein LOC127080153 [Lathyrus oleraceus]|uniref:uncharacterized protein LOC127080153 n=1 Tax=Pisum sativum TaxID=3888 RepID=UPI0021D2811F|nr:uncharacterized protein LOC127080153 [Pisum sativum]